MTEATKTSFEWYFMHSLAGLSSVTLAVLFFASAYLNATGADVVHFPAVARGALAVGVFALLWLWIRMLVDFFRQRPARNPVLWGWVLFLASIIAGVFYFWLVWRPRNRVA